MAGCFVLGAGPLQQWVFPPKKQAVMQPNANLQNFS
jgi:hypothetical protein